MLGSFFLVFREPRTEPGSSQGAPDFGPGVCLLSRWQLLHSLAPDGQSSKGTCGTEVGYGRVGGAGSLGEARSPAENKPPLSPGHHISSCGFSPAQKLHMKPGEHKVSVALRLGLCKFRQGHIQEPTQTWLLSVCPCTCSLRLSGNQTIDPQAPSVAFLPLV